MIYDGHQPDGGHDVAGTSHSFANIVPALHAIITSTQYCALLGLQTVSLSSPRESVPKHKVIACAVRHPNRATECMFDIREANMHP